MGNLVSLSVRLHNFCEPRSEPTCQQLRSAVFKFLSVACVVTATFWHGWEGAFYPEHNQLFILGFVKGVMPCSCSKVRKAMFVGVVRSHNVAVVELMPLISWNCKHENTNFTFLGSQLHNWFLHWSETITVSKGCQFQGK